MGGVNSWKSVLTQGERGAYYEGASLCHFCLSQCPLSTAVLAMLFTKKPA